MVSDRLKKLQTYVLGEEEIVTLSVFLRLDGLGPGVETDIDM